MSNKKDPITGQFICEACWNMAHKKCEGQNCGCACQWAEKKKQEFAKKKAARGQTDFVPGKTFE